MPARFISNLPIALLGGALAACSLLFGPAVVQWFVLGVGWAVVAITLLAFATRGRAAEAIAARDARVPTELRQPTPARPDIAA
jgi:hypothetical protein